MPLNELLLGQGAFIARAEALPSRPNQRPGVTLLMGAGAGLQLDVQGQGHVEGPHFLFAPQVRRRFVGPQPHCSVTVEPGHPLYLEFLAWARATPQCHAPLKDAVAQLDRVAAIHTQTALDAWLLALLEDHGHTVVPADRRLRVLLQLVQACGEDIRAEDLWARFRAQFPATQAHHSHWLQETLGLSLRQWLLWRKLRRALDALADQNHATQIAHAAGFADSAHLSRICQRTFGLRPSEAANHKILQVKYVVAV